MMHTGVKIEMGNAGRQDLAHTYLVIEFLKKYIPASL